MKYRLVIFDMDGTILNTIDDLTNAVNYALDKCSYPLRTKDEVQTYVGNGIRRTLELAAPSSIDNDEREKLYQIFVPYYQKHSLDLTKPYPGIIELLQYLKAHGYLTAVVSNKSDLAVKNLAEQFFPSLFDVAIGEDEANGVVRKPAPDEVNIALDTLHIKRSDAIYIGDSDVDIATARNSGLDLIAVDWGFKSHDFLVEHGAEVICSNIHEIIKYLECK